MTVIEIVFAFITNGLRLEGNIDDYRKDIDSALRRLRNNKKQLWENKPNTHYVIVCCVTKQFTEDNNRQRYPAKLSSVRSGRKWVTKKAIEIFDKELSGPMVYWTSDHRLDQPGWIFPEVTLSTK